MERHAGVTLGTFIADRSSMMGPRGDEGRGPGDGRLEAVRSLTSRRRATVVPWALVSLLLMTAAACGRDPALPPSFASSPAPAPSAETCGRAGAAPATYEHVVVVLEENRTWDQVGGVGFGDLPWLGQLAAGCSVYTSWLETNPERLVAFRPQQS